MAELKVGGITPSKIFYGSTPVKEVCYGSTKIWPPAPKHPAWSEDGSYQVGDIVSYQGKYYQLIRPFRFYTKDSSPGAVNASLYWREVSPGSTSPGASPGYGWGGEPWTQI